MRVQVVVVEALKPEQYVLTGYQVTLSCGHAYKQVPHMSPPKVGVKKWCWRCEKEKKEKV